MRPVPPEPAEYPQIRRAMRAARFMKLGAPIVAVVTMVLSIIVGASKAWHFGISALVVSWGMLYVIGYSAARCPHCGQVWWSPFGMFGTAAWGIIEFGPAVHERHVCGR